MFESSLLLPFDFEKNSEKAKGDRSSDIFLRCSIMCNQDYKDAHEKMKLMSRRFGYYKA